LNPIAILQLALVDAGSIDTCSISASIPQEVRLTNPLDLAMKPGDRLSHDPDITVLASPERHPNVRFSPGQHV
jgi:hypothetical protein